MNRKRIPLFTLITSLFALLVSCSSSPSGPASKDESSAQSEGSSISNSSKEESKVQESSVYEPPVEEEESVEEFESIVSGEVFRVDRSYFSPYQYMPF